MTTTAGIYLKPMSEFTANGRLKGTIAAYDAETDRYICEVDCANWSDVKQREKAIQEISRWSGRDPDVVARAVMLFLSQLRADEAAMRANPSGGTVRPADAPGDLPVISITQLERLEQIDRAWSALKAVNRPTPQYFRYGAHIADATASRPRVLNKAAVTGVLLRSAKWVRGEQSADPPEQVVDDMMNYGLPDLPALRGVKESPFCRPDGSFVIEPGYDPDSGYILAQHGLRITTPETVGEADLAAARSLLFRVLLKDFPFVSDADKAHEIAAMLTPIVMPMIDGPIPLFMFTAPTPRSGKGLLATVASIVGTGTAPPPQSLPYSDESVRKIITTKLKAAVPTVYFDNISEKGRLDSPSLAALLTAPDRMWSDREMGTNRDLVLPNNTLWLATANNANVHDEIAARILAIAIDPKTERPELIKHDQPDGAPSLDAWTKANRGKLLSAVLAFVRAWVQQGKPAGTEVFGGFETWVKVIGGILAVAGIPGLLKNREQFRESAASELEEIKPFITIWAQVYQSRDVSVGNLLKMCSADDVDLLPSVRAGLRVEQAVAKLDQFLRSIQNRTFTVEGIRFRITRGGVTETRRRGWRLEVVN